MSSNLLQQQVMEEVQIEMSRKSLFEFIKYTFPYPVLWKWYHEYISGVLQSFVEGLRIVPAICNRLMIFMPSQHGKTTLMTEYLPAWNFGQNPNSQTLLTMYDSLLAGKYNRKIQRIMTTDKYVNIFPHTRLGMVRTGQDVNYVRNVHEFEIVNHIGFLKSVGVGGGIAGNPAKLALIDDVIKNIMEANSEVYRDRIYEWYVDELETRLHNDSGVLFTITRRHEDDLAGRLLKRDGLIEEGGKWKVIILPAIKEDNNSSYDTREIGEALFPEMHSLQRLLEVKKKSPRTFVNMYQQRPVPSEGNLVNIEWIGRFRLSTIQEMAYDNHSHLVWNYTIDGAYTKNTLNAPTALMAYCYYENYMYIRDVIQVWYELPELIKLIPDWVRRNGYTNESSIYIEPEASGRPAAQMLLLQTPLNVILDKDPRSDKTVRFKAKLPFIEAKRMKLLEGAPWINNYLDELKHFPHTKYKDMTDVTTMAIDRCEGYVEGGAVLGMRSV